MISALVNLGIVAGAALGSKTAKAVQGATSGI